MELLHQGTGYTVGYLKFAAKSLNCIKKKAIGRKIALICNFSADGMVLDLVKIRIRLVKHCVVPETEGLMNLKIKTN